MGTKQNEKTVKACLTCTTPYQLMGAISIVQGLKLEADLYLFGMFPDYDKIAGRLGKYGIFRRVVPVDCSRFRSLSLTKALWQMMNSRKTVSFFLAQGECYDEMYTSSRAHVKLLMRKELEHRNPRMKFVIFEDGLGTYSAKSHVLVSSRLRRIVEKVFRWDSFAPDRTTLMATHPELVELPKKLEGVSVRKMPTLNWTKDNCKMLLDVFSVSGDELIDERVIIFDVTRGVYKDDLGVKLDLLDDCYQLLKDMYSYNDVICKVHPRSKQKSKAEIKEYQKKGTPVEILYAGMTDLENRILVGTFSTALFTPKMMFGKEPFVICLYRMVWPHNTEIPPLFEKLSKMYQHQERVMAPCDMAELKRCLKTLPL